MQGSIIACPTIYEHVALWYSMMLVIVLGNFSIYRSVMLMAAPRN